MSFLGRNLQGHKSRLTIHSTWRSWWCHCLLFIITFFWVTLQHFQVYVSNNFFFMRLTTIQIYFYDLDCILTYFPKQFSSPFFSPIFLVTLTYIHDFDYNTPTFKKHISQNLIVYFSTSTMHLLLRSTLAKILYSLLPHINNPFIPYAQPLTNIVCLHFAVHIWDKNTHK